MKGETYRRRRGLKAASSSPAFGFLDDPEEDIYTLEDGVPFRDD